MIKIMLTVILGFSLVFFLKAQTKPNKKLIVAFGSCNKQNLPQPLWSVISRNKPDVWIWLGDNIYGDSNDMSVISAKYTVQLNQPDYKKFASSSVQIIGTWDDHDYGRNDAGINYPHKKETQQLALDFLKEPKGSLRRKQEGIYASYNYKVGKKTVKVILLDGRYNRDTIMRENNSYIPNTSGDMLGEVQWKWLENELNNSTADAHIIGSGVQVLSDQHPYEKWANFPASRKRLFDLVSSSKAKGVLFISGDRHIGEFSKTQIKGLDYPVYDITSSGLTHSATTNKNEANSYRTGPLVNKRHFGLFEFKQKGNKLKVEIELIGIHRTFHKEKMVL